MLIFLQILEDSERFRSPNHLFPKDLDPDGNDVLRQCSGMTARFDQIPEAMKYYC